MQHLQVLQVEVPFSRPSTPRSHPHQIGFVGLGNMGYLMARNLAKHNAAHTTGSLPLLVWNRSSDKAESLVTLVGADKARVAKDLDEVAQLCDIIVTSLSNDAAVQSVYEQFSKSLTEHPPTRNKIFVETSTVYPSLSGELDQQLSSHPLTHLVTCPVVGPPIAADKAQLLLLMSGNYRSKKEVAYLFIPAVGRKAIDLGGDIEKAPTFKLIANSMILGNLQVLAEAFTLSRKTGIDSDRVLELVKDIFPTPIHANYANKMATGQFDGSKGFAIDNGIKDAMHIRRLTAEYDSPMPVVDVVYQHLLSARAIHKNDTQSEFETLDWSSLVAGTRVAAGLPPFDTNENAVEKED
ncbi:hypothetical protein M378DRAFT_188988 [Amanita muscaria Koide BX008]|uniref:NAD(P)-binding protein n=1 Tax=Amanita muscaria (strain Koide BX008) TaxID=946122 RepID=A0A0C2T6H6_AMAMK|nr:hypothetical protein M378DRAFT_188988 [Amanita muscaria Koide BX008]